MIAALQDAISTGRWPTGSRLPTESDLADEIGVSRVTLRQAVQALVHVGLLETIQGNGTFVRATTELDAVLSRYLAGEDLLSVLEVREAIETVAAALAAGRRSPADVDALDEAVDAQQEAEHADDQAGVAQASARFHTTVVQDSGNPILIHFYAAVQAGAARTFADARSPQTPAEFLDEHRGIAAAIRDQDVERARSLSQRHLQPVIQSFVDSASSGQKFE